MGSVEMLLKWFLKNVGTICIVFSQVAKENKHFYYFCLRFLNILGSVFYGYWLLPDKMLRSHSIKKDFLNLLGSVRAY